MRIKKNSRELVSLIQEQSAKKYGLTPIRSSRSAVIYTRVSSKEQAENNSSLEIQAKLCGDYARKTGLLVKQLFGGTYESAKTDGRKEFQRMLSYVQMDKDISFIIVYNFDRFSRTGPAAAQLSAELAKKGIIVKSVTQEIDNSTPAGQLQENIFHIFNNYDNLMRSQRIRTNTKELLLKGYWPYHTPIGYENLKPKHKCSEHIYRISEKGKWIKKVFQWKAEGILTNKEIVKRIRHSGLSLTAKNFRNVISNPFYAGYVTGSLVNGKLIKGHHPAMISLELYLKANNIQQGETRAGILKFRRIEELPLKVFARSEQSGKEFTGYSQKAIWYYKARGVGNPVNIRAEKLNKMFAAFLESFEYDNRFKAKLEKALLSKLKEQTSETVSEQITFKKRLTELKNKLEELEERFVLQNLDKDLYEKYAVKYRQDITALQFELDKQQLDSSNLEMIVIKGLKIAENISQLWVSSDFSNKQKLQYLIFPKGVTYCKQNDEVRTEYVNALFAQIPLLAKDIAEEKKGSFRKSCQKSLSVELQGFEP